MIEDRQYTKRELARIYSPDTVKIKSALIKEMPSVSDGDALCK